MVNPRLDPKGYIDEQKRQQREAVRQRREDHKAYADRVRSDREADEAAKRQERDAEQRATVEARLRKRFLAFGGTEESFNERKAALVAEEMKRQSDAAGERQTAQARKRAARVF